MRLITALILFLGCMAIALSAVDKANISDKAGVRIIDCGNKIERWYQIAAKGDAFAQTCLGMIYLDKGDTHYKDAYIWLNRAVNNGSLDAGYHLAVMYDEGMHVRKNKNISVNIYLEMANKGHKISQHNLSVAYLNGDGIQKNYEKAFYWARESAVKGYSDAQNNLGVMYERGFGIDIDHNEAVYWYKLAADQHNSAAINNLAHMYASGKGMKTDVTKAVSLWRKAAKLGNPESQYNLSFAYAHGFGIEKNHRLSRFWFIVSELCMGQDLPVIDSGNDLSYDIKRMTRLEAEKAAQKYCSPVKE